tara:strand:+ start:9390 stop:11153 length:1764 start_codon:yes stop_codon:yes gene_type:complete
MGLTDTMTDSTFDRLFRRKNQQEPAARAEAEAQLKQQNLELVAANQKLSAHCMQLEQALRERTAELRVASQQAEATSQVQSRFVATMSHEIRNPLGDLLGMIDLLGIDEQDMARKELLETAKMAGEGLNRVVNDVLDFFRMEAGSFVFKVEHVDIRALIESVRMKAVASKGGKQRDFLVNIDNNVPKLFLGDAARFRQVMANFVDNALRYSTHGPITIRVTARPDPRGQLLRVEVEHFGVGLPEAKVSEFFMDFSQIIGSLPAAVHGTGLGLAMCKRIIESCGGGVGIENHPGEGAIFWAELPVEVVVPVERHNQQGISASNQTQHVDLEGKRVLIAENNLANQKLLIGAVSGMGLDAEVAGNGNIALDVFSPEKFDVVLLNVALPELNGFETIRRLTENWEGSDMPSFLLFAEHDSDAIREEAKQLGVDFVLSKPIPSDALQAALIAKLSAGADGTQVDQFPQSEAETMVAPVETSKTILDMLSPAAAKDLEGIFDASNIAAFVQKYITDAVERLDKMQDAIASGQRAVVTGEAHSLKGASYVFGFADISDWAQTIEKSDPIEDPEAVLAIVKNIRERLALLQALV